MSRNYEVRYIELGDHFSITDLPEEVVRLDADDSSTLDMMPPDRVARWIQAHHESGRLKPIENKLGFTSIYIQSCDIPVDDPQSGAVFVRRDHMFMVGQPSES